ncbi:hypothetical protein CDD82_6667 [Ophiocordyceps australis]|uniref:Uncharacterized protein n=1 Tax=Ophiocordyceps australis TaxID=1399860 RepID=A0A2C5XG66_9HYPO|nr:hypothetical protein CDD82_6667 [Ophiocordyceps australis]
MFQLADAKRIRRQDLGDSADSQDDELDADVQAVLQARLAQTLQLECMSGVGGHDDDDGQVEEEEEEEEDKADGDVGEFDFCLFGTGPAKVRLEADAGDGAGGRLRR